MLIFILLYPSLSRIIYRILHPQVKQYIPMFIFTLLNPFLFKHIFSSKTKISFKLSLATQKSFHSLPLSSHSSIAITLFLLFILSFLVCFDKYKYSFMTDGAFQSISKIHGTHFQTLTSESIK